MRLRRFRVGIAIALAILAGGLGYTLVAAGVIPTGPTDQAATKPFPDPTTSAPVLPDSFPPNPDAGLSDAERDARYKQGWNEFEQRYTAWLNALDIDKLDLRSLPRGQLAAQYVPGESSLPDAVAAADLIVVGSVSAIRPTPFSGTVTTISVNQTLKGPDVSTVSVTQAGGLQPTQDWTGVVIAEGENGAMLLPGDRAILLLQKDSSGEYYIQSSSGWYQVVDGHVKANPYNSWGTALNGMPEAEFIQLLAAAAL